MIGRWRRCLGLGRPPPSGLLAALSGPLDPMGQLLLDDAAGAAMVMGADGRIIRANAALGQLLSGAHVGQPAADTIGAVAEAAREAVWAELRPLLQGRAAVAKTFIARITMCGGEQDVRVTALPLREPGQRVSGVLLRFADITAQRQLEAQLLHSQKLQATGQLAGGIAHDFNNLLTAMIGAVDGILERRETLNAAGLTETYEDAHQIRESAQRGAALVRQLLAFGRQQTLQPRVLAVNDVIADVSTLLRRLLGGGIRLELALEQPGRLVRADPTQLDQVLINLAVNARNAMREGGVLTLRSGHITLFRPLAHGVETIPPGRYVMIEVQDTGSGIPPEVLPRIFDPFFTTRRDQGGSGLGLATVHGIVRQSDGFVAVDSTVGAGTSLRIYLPRWDETETIAIPRAPLPAPMLPAEPAQAAPRQGQGALVLVVDDEDPVRRLAERAITRAGFTVLSADGGDTALALLAARDPSLPMIDAVVTDMMMPGMDGPSLLRMLRSRTGLADLPAILVSGFAESELRRGLAGDRTLFLAKPYTLAELVGTLNSLISPPQR